MFATTFFRRVIFNFAFIFVFLSIYILLFFPIYTSNTIIINFVKKPFNICEKYPEIWQNLKSIYVIISSISSLITINIIYSSLFTKKKIKKQKMTNIPTRFISFCRKRQT